MTRDARLDDLIGHERTRLAGMIPADRVYALTAIVAAVDVRNDLAFGAGEAFRAFAEAPGTTGSFDIDAFLGTATITAELVEIAAAIEEGSSRAIWQGNAVSIVPIGQRVPSRTRERADLAWWRTIADPVTVQRAYPPATTIDGVDLDLAVRMIAWLHDRPAGTLVRDIAIEGAAVAMDAPRDDVAAVLDALTATPDSLRWHAAVPDVALPPVIGSGGGLLVRSRAGLAAWPLFFLHREVRRRAGNAYHTAAHLRENVFRNDLARIFGDKRFVTSTAPLRLAKDAGGLRTDIDAAVFDRKTGTLATFELKFQDPFARSAEERIRQRENVLAAKRQVSGTLAWIQKHGPDDLLNRIDNRLARQFRVRKVFPFVLGRYHLHLEPGLVPDARAAWGTWPDVLRVAQAAPFDGKAANPIATLHTRLSRGIPQLPLPRIARTLRIAGVTLQIEPPGSSQAP